MSAARHTADQIALFASPERPKPVSLPDGFVYREAVIAPDEEKTIATQLRDLPFTPFEFRGYLGKRRVASFGWRYDYGGRALRESKPIPSFLLPLREKAASIAGIRADDLRQVLITEYDSGAGIGWHRDKPLFDDVVAFSFLAPCTLRFRRTRAAGGWERATPIVEPRSAYLLRGPSRWDWEHSIPPLDRLRYSVTFRNFVPDDPRRRET